MKICNIGRKLIIILSQLQMSMFFGTPKSDYVIYFWPFECAHLIWKIPSERFLFKDLIFCYSLVLEISIITVNTNMTIIINHNSNTEKLKWWMGFDEKFDDVEEDSSKMIENGGNWFTLLLLPPSLILPSSELEEKDAIVDDVVSGRFIRRLISSSLL